MNKEDLVAYIAQKAGMTKVAAKAALDATLDGIEYSLAKGDKVSLIGFGTFEVRERAAREGRNPLNGAVIQIEAKSVPAFSAGKGLKDAVAR